MHHAVASIVDYSPAVTTTFDSGGTVMYPLNPQPGSGGGLPCVYGETFVCNDKIDGINPQNFYRVNINTGSFTTHTPTTLSTTVRTNNVDSNGDIYFNLNFTAFYKQNPSDSGDGYLIVPLLNASYMAYASALDVVMVDLSTTECKQCALVNWPGHTEVVHTIDVGNRIILAMQNANATVGRVYGWNIDRNAIGYVNTLTQAWVSLNVVASSPAQTGMVVGLDECIYTVIPSTGKVERYSNGGTLLGSYTPPSPGGTCYMGAYTNDGFIWIFSPQGGTAGTKVWKIRASDMSLYASVTLAPRSTDNPWRIAVGGFFADQTSPVLFQWEAGRFYIGKMVEA